MGDDPKEDDSSAVLFASKRAVESLSENVGSLWCCSTIAVLDEPPSPLMFLRDFCAVSRPCIIRNSEACSVKSLDELVSSYGHVELTVDVTPDGHGDCLRLVKDSEQVQQLQAEEECNDIKPMFVKPLQQKMTMKDFVERLRGHEEKSMSHHEYRSRVFESTNDSDDDDDVSTPSTTEEAVYYYSLQNDCLRQELETLWNNSTTTSFFARSFDWADQAFGVAPDAVNLWIGNQQAHSSMHKDHYENLFCVIQGEKVFTLCPPADVPFLYEQEVLCGSFCYRDGCWKVRVETDETVHWVCANVNTPDDNFPLLQYAHPITVHVKAGEMLYLPSLWFHSVTQTCETVGINYWYDQRFDSPHWTYFHFLQQLSPTTSSTHQ